MEEADILGDRIIVMYRGCVIGWGSPSFLKNACGVGYKLRIKKDQSAFKSEELLAVVRKTVLQAAVEEEKENEATKRMKNGDKSLFFTFYRMTPDTFDFLLSMVQGHLTKEKCPSREPIFSGERLALIAASVTWHAAEGHSHGFSCGNRDGTDIIIETCTVLRNVLSPLYMKIYFETDHVDFIVKATCVLHNFLSSDAAATYCPPGYTECQDMFGTVSGDTRRQGGTTTAVFGLQGAKATAMRQNFTAYFAKEVQVPWQWKLSELTSG
ncbi:hypothetical protein HPB50_012134 [Hyalomma asiaticum]|uniref:Uncharacterized protein n=1 Tax=Hyalomma asiaticum TaxID=266040 RepID=A0ACB7S981_HYAAI|nr:hypothetical protein HPB50_012134 [Hyalomma asiaticum]